MQKSTKENLDHLNTEHELEQPTQTYEQSVELIKQSGLSLRKKIFLHDLMKYGKQSEIDFIPIFFELSSYFQDCYLGTFNLYTYDLSKESEFDFTRTLTKYFKKKK